MVLWISHRGLHSQHTENTREAFSASVEKGFQGLETDLRLSADSCIVLSHDLNLARTAGKDIRVDQLTRRQLEEVSLIKGGRVFFLDDFVKEFAGMHWIFDIKPEHGNQVILQIREWLNSGQLTLAALATTRFLLWDRQQEKQLLQCIPQARIIPSEWDCYRAGFAIKLGLPFLSGVQKELTYSLIPYFKGICFLTPGMVNSYHALGAKVLAYLPKNQAEMEMAKAAGVDEILSDGLII